MSELKHIGNTSLISTFGSTASIKTAIKEVTRAFQGLLRADFQALKGVGVKSQQASPYSQSALQVTLPPGQVHVFSGYRTGFAKGRAEPQLLLDVHTHDPRTGKRYIHTVSNITPSSSQPPSLPFLPPPSPYGGKPPASFLPPPPHSAEPPAFFEPPPPYSEEPPASFSSPASQPGRPLSSPSNQYPPASPVGPAVDDAGSPIYRAGPPPYSLNAARPGPALPPTFRQSGPVPTSSHLQKNSGAVPHSLPVAAVSTPSAIPSTAGVLPPISANKSPDIPPEDLKVEVDRENIKIPLKSMEHPQDFSLVNSANSLHPQQKLEAVPHPSPVDAVKPNNAIPSKAKSKILLPTPSQSHKNKVLISNEERKVFLENIASRNAKSVSVDDLKKPIQKEESKVLISNEERKVFLENIASRNAKSVSVDDLKKPIQKEESKVLISNEERKVFLENIASRNAKSVSVDDLKKPIAQEKKNKVEELNKEYDQNLKDINNLKNEIEKNPDNYEDYETILNDCSDREMSIRNKKLGFSYLEKALSVWSVMDSAGFDKVYEDLLKEPLTKEEKNIADELVGQYKKKNKPIAES